MGLFNWLERKMFLGEVVHNFGPLCEEAGGLVKTKTTASLCRQKGRTQLVFKQTNRALLSFSVSYVRLDMNTALLQKLREIDKVTSKLV